MRCRCLVFVGVIFKEHFFNSIFVRWIRAAFTLREPVCNRLFYICAVFIKLSIYCSCSAYMRNVFISFYAPWMDCEERFISGQEVSPFRQQHQDCANVWRVFVDELNMFSCLRSWLVGAADGCLAGWWVSGQTEMGRKTEEVDDCIVVCNSMMWCGTRQRICFSPDCCDRLGKCDSLVSSIVF